MDFDDIDVGSLVRSDKEITGSPKHPTIIEKIYYLLGSVKTKKKYVYLLKNGHHNKYMKPAIDGDDMVSLYMIGNNKNPDILYLNWEEFSSFSYR